MYDILASLTGFPTHFLAKITKLDKSGANLIIESAFIQNSVFKIGSDSVKPVQNSLK